MPTAQDALMLAASNQNSLGMSSEEIEKRQHLINVVAEYNPDLAYDIAKGPYRVNNSQPLGSTATPQEAWMRGTGNDSPVSGWAGAAGQPGGPGGPPMVGAPGTMTPSMAAPAPPAGPPEWMSGVQGPPMQDGRMGYAQPGPPAPSGPGYSFPQNAQGSQPPPPSQFGGVPEFTYGGPPDPNKGAFKQPPMYSPTAPYTTGNQPGAPPFQFPPSLPSQPFGPQPFSPQLSPSWSNEGPPGFAGNAMWQGQRGVGLPMPQNQYQRPYMPPEGLTNGMYQR